MKFTKKLYVLPGLIWLLAFLTLTMRIIYWVSISSDPWSIAPGTDPQFYKEWALSITNGNHSDFIPFPRAPLYPYLLALIMKLFGTGWIITRVPNLLFEIITTIIIFKVTENLVDKRSGIIAAVLYAICGTAIYFSAELLMTSLATMLNLAIIASLLYFSRKPGFPLLILNAVCLASLILLRPNSILYLLPVSIIVVFIYYYNSQNISQIAGKILIYFATIMIMLLPVTIINWNKTGSIIPISIQGGINFYIGNAQNASGWSSTLPGAGASWNDGDAVRIASEHAGKSLKSWETSAEYWKMGLEEIIEQPVGWLKLMLKKTWLLFSNMEIANNRPFGLALDSSILLRFCWLITIGSLLPFAILGIILTRKNKQTWIIAAIMLTNTFSILLFFVSSRYRMPLVPLVIIMASIGISQLKSLFRREKYLWTYGLPILLVSVFVFPNWFGIYPESEAQKEFVLGNSYLRLDKLTETIAHYRKAADHDPNFPDLNLNIGVVQLRRGDTLSSINSFNRELSNNPNNSKALNNLGTIYQQQGMNSRAVELYERAARADSSNSNALGNLSNLFQQLGMQFLAESDLDSAEYYFFQMLRVNPENSNTLFYLGLIKANQAQWSEARELLRESLERDPSHELAKLLLNELTRFP